MRAGPETYPFRQAYQGRRPWAVRIFLVARQQRVKVVADRHNAASLSCLERLDRTTDHGLRTAGFRVIQRSHTTSSLRSATFVLSPAVIRTKRRTNDVRNHSGAHSVGIPLIVVRHRRGADDSGN